MKTRIAIPLAGGRLAQHFGHSEQFSLIDVDPATRKITGSLVEAAPEHEPGLLPRWLHERGVTVVITGGMGGRARDLLAEAGIEVVAGAVSGEPENIARDYLSGTLVAGVNSCDHAGGHQHGGCSH